jgi:acetate---CoA ligase (ADP-forming)
MKNISAIMSPRSVAVIGATDRPGSVGQAVFANILKGGFKGILYPVNPTKRSVMSVRTYPSLSEIPDEVDMAVVIVPPKAVAAVVEEAAKKGTQGLVIITAGFKEMGGEGLTREKELVELANKHGIRMIGPNCLGITNTHPDVSLNASFAPRAPRPGSIAFISQSGALCTAVLDFAEAKHIGFSKFISFGNKADVNEIDLLRYLKDDPETKVIAMYLEDISNGRQFIETAREICWDAKKPMLAIKSGRTSEGAKAASSHTGSLAGSDLAYDAIFGQSGILRVDTMNELFDSAFAFASQPPPRGKRIAIVTNAGGPGIIATDSVIRQGLQLATFSDLTQQKLRECLPAAANTHNPVDVIGDAKHDRYEAAINHVLADDGVDGVVVILTPTAMIDVKETAEIIPKVAIGGTKPLLCSFMGVVDVSVGVEYLEAHGLPNYIFPEYAVRAMSNMVKFGWLLGLQRREVRRIAADRDAATQIIRRKLDAHGDYMLPANEAQEILACYGFPLLRHGLATTADEAAKIAEDIGYPLAMKISSPDIIHKFDAGGVKLRVASAKDAAAAFTEIITNVKKFKADAEIKGVQVEKMARGGVEIILGATRDPKFGPICMFGLGGTFVEVMKDVTFRLAPMWEVSAEIMINSIKSYKLLKGVRGMPPSDIDAIKDCLLRLSQMVSNHPEIAELDINPLIVYPEGEGCVVADSRIKLTKIPIGP